MDIHHGMMVRNIKPERLYEALTRQDDLAIWMGASTLAQPDVGSMIEFQFDQGKFMMKGEVFVYQPQGTDKLNFAERQVETFPLTYGVVVVEIPDEVAHTYGFVPLDFKRRSTNGSVQPPLKAAAPSTFRDGQAGGSRHTSHRVGGRLWWPGGSV